MAKSFTDHLSSTVRTTKDAVRFGPLKVRRFPAVPTDIEGRNGDLVIIDDTAEVSDKNAESRIPTNVELCQKIPLVVTGGDFTITTVAGVFTITIASLDDFVEAVNRAQIPGVNLEHDPRGSVTLNTIASTWADGSSDLPSVLGLAGAQAGTSTIAVGRWECISFPGSVNVSEDGTLVGNFNDINFTGPGVSSVVDAGSGRVTVTITGGGAGGGPGYGMFALDTGSTTATIASENITFTGTGITTTGTNGGAGLDVIDFELDIADLPAGGPPAETDEIAVNIGGTTVRTPISDLPVTQITGLDITTINGQPMLTLEDTTRGNKILSVAEQTLTYAENQLGDQDWIRVANANDIDSGYVMDFDGTLVFATGHCENTGVGVSKDVRLFINGVDNGVVGTLSGGADVSFTSTTLDIDFSQGDKIRLRADNGAGGAIQDTIVKLTVKWRG